MLSMLRLHMGRKQILHFVQDDMGGVLDNMGAFRMIWGHSGWHEGRFQMAIMSHDDSTFVENH